MQDLEDLLTSDSIYGTKLCWAVQITAAPGSVSPGFGSQREGVNLSPRVRFDKEESGTKSRSTLTIERVHGHSPR